jgi:hypothetical protein
MLKVQHAGGAGGGGRVSKRLPAASSTPAAGAKADITGGPRGAGHLGVTDTGEDAAA